MRKALYQVGGILCLTCMPNVLHAQIISQRSDSTLNRTVVVEQEYAPVIMDASKVNVLPKVEEPTVVKRNVEYALTPSPATAIPFGVMQAYVVPEVQSSAVPGYLRVGYGNYGNLDVLGNYRFRISKHDFLNVQLGAEGMNGELDMPDGGEWDTHYYRMRADIGYTHRFSKMDFDLAVRLGLSDFKASLYDKGDQQFLSGDFHAGVTSTDATLPLQFQAETNVMMYNRKHNSSLFDDDGLGETQIHTKGKVSGEINEEQLVSIGFDMHNIFYNKDFKMANGQTVYENRTALTLNPRYEFHNDVWKIFAGINADFSFGNGETFRVSPDVGVEFTFADSYILYVQATGGKTVNDFRQLESFCPYVLPITTVRDTYEQVNASLGLKGSPCSGLWFHLYGGYQDLKDDVSQVYYRPNLDLAFTDTHNLYAGVGLVYSYKDLFEFSGSGVYRNWEADNDYALLLKPSFEFDCNVLFRPLSVLGVRVGYEYVYREKVEEMERFSSVSNLYASAEYTFYKKISVYARFRNLLDKEYQYYLGYPTEGFNFVGGLAFCF